MAHRQTKQELFQEVADMIGPPAQQERLEIEARIGYFKGTHFVSSVTPKIFYRVLEYFLERTPTLFTYVKQDITLRTEAIMRQKLPTMPDTVIEAIFDIPRRGNERYGGRIRESFAHEKYRFYSTKRTVRTVDMPELFTRFAVAEEREYGDKPPAGFPANTQPNTLRIKKRWSFVVDESHILSPYRVDFTHVTGWITDHRTGKRRDINSHEIELEVINKPIVNAEQELWPGVHYLLELVQDTPFPVPSSTISGVIQGFNNLFTSDINTMISDRLRRNPRYNFNRNWQLFNAVNKPINLKKKVLDEPQYLAITDKADGERRLMYIYEDSAYLLYPPGAVMRYLRASGPKQTGEYYISKEMAARLSGTVLDGELVMQNDGKRAYLAFDILMNRGRDVRDKPFNQRFDIMTKLLSDNPINVKVKRFYMPEEANFYTRVGMALDSIERKPYGNDGLIFNDVRDDYTHGKVYKWKPADKMTIDFYVRAKSPTEFDLLVKDVKELGLFKGSRKHPYSGTVILDPPVFNGSPIATGQIVEMAWDYKGNRFVPFRIRYDRDQPNFKDTAADVWNDIMEPITVETISGTDLVAMRRYHNRIKEAMLQDNCSGDGLIVDLGAGRGGDIHKWKRLGREVQVLAIEPNSEYLTEFHKRLIESGYEALRQSGSYKFNNGDESVSLNLMQGYGQDTAKIVKAMGTLYPDQRASCVTIFNVITFFYEKEGYLDALVNTVGEILKIGGRFIGLVMDGKKVREILVKDYTLRNILKHLRDDEYWNIDTESVISVDTAKKIYHNEKWRIATKNKRSLVLMTERLNSDPISGTVEDASWSIEAMGPITEDPYGNKIRINLGPTTIVQNQIEYLVDFEELRRKLQDKGIVLENTQMLEGDPALSVSQQKLNELYRSFVFVRKVKSAQEQLDEFEELIAQLASTKTTITLEEAREFSAIRKRLREAVRQERQPPESEQIVTETTVNPEANFVPIETGDVSMLDAESQAPMTVRNIDFTRIGTIDGECILAALLRASFPDYILGHNKTGAPALTKIERKKRDRSIARVADYIINNAFEKAYSGGKLKGIKKDWDSAKTVLEDCKNWRFFDLWGPLGDSLKVNITVVSRDSPTDLSIRRYGGSHKKTIVLYTKNGVYDVLAQKDALGNLVTTFKKGDITIEAL